MHTSINLWQLIQFIKHEQHQHEQPTQSEIKHEQIKSNHSPQIQDEERQNTNLKQNLKVQMHLLPGVNTRI